MAHTSAPTLGKVKGWNQEAVHLTEVRYALQNSIESAIQPKKSMLRPFYHCVSTRVDACNRFLSGIQG
jgi:hypothetical protein